MTEETLQRHWHRRLEVVSIEPSPVSASLERTTYRCKCGHEWPIDDPIGQTSL